MSNSYRQYRAPDQHGIALVDPDFDQAGRMLVENRALTRHLGLFSDALKSRAREALVEKAIQYTGAYRDVAWAHDRIAAAAAEVANRPEKIPPTIILSGHQPTLFHPGVWFKNFALSHLGKQHNAVPINLIVDNDISTGSSLRVPTRVDQQQTSAAGLPEIRRQTIAYDRTGGGVPYEQLMLQDTQTFAAFAQQVQRVLAGLVGDPLITRLWPLVTDAIESCNKIGCAFAQGRHALEGELGLGTLEVPLSTLCGEVEFAQFSLSILTDLPRFHASYNSAADHYRHAHGIRSTAHPVPNLNRDGDWLEAPFWVYSDHAPERQPVWAKIENNTLHLCDTVAVDTRQHQCSIDLAATNQPAEQLAGHLSPAFKLRPRALITTMYSRLILSDLFLHGIGGGKYDQLGDRIIESFFQIQPPSFMVLSATVQLPTAQLSPAQATPAQATISEIKRQLRDTVYQPERFAERVSMDSQLIRRKRELIEQGQPESAGSSANQSRKAWHDEITSINQTLSSQLGDISAALQDQLATAQSEKISRTILTSREHAYCLHPLDHLTGALQSMLPPKTNQT